MNDASWKTSSARIDRGIRTCVVERVRKRKNVKEAGIDVSRPNASTAERKEAGNILIAIRSNGDVWIDKRQVDIRSVRANVERLHAENPEGAVVIIADKASETGRFVEVMDQVRLAGVENVSIAAQEPGS